MNPYLHFLWFRQILFDHFGEFEIIGYPELSREEAIGRYMLWAIKEGFLHTFGNPDPVAGIILRPVNYDQIEQIKTDWASSFTLFDRKADTLWIDFMHAPGNYSFMINFVSQLGRHYLAWHNTRRDKIRIAAIEDLKEHNPLNCTQALNQELIPLDLSSR